ncbi:hypothetical protein [Nonomuraea dietziae]
MRSLLALLLVAVPPVEAPLYSYENAIRETAWVELDGRASRWI